MRPRALFFFFVIFSLLSFLCVVGKSFGVKPQNICLRIRAYFIKRGIKSKEARETERAGERGRRFRLVFLFEQRDDALDDAKLLYVFVHVVLRK